MRKFHLLIIKNNFEYPLIDDIQKTIEYEKKWKKRELIVDYIDINLPIKHKQFPVVFPQTGKKGYGLDGIKQQLRDTGKIPYKAYHAICFLYKEDDWDHKEKTLGAWTYPTPLKGSAFMEIPFQPNDEENDQLYRVLTHEMIHCDHRICWWNGIPTKDTMDVYDKEFFVEAPDGNRARNIKELEPYQDIICRKPIVRKIYECIIDVLIKLIKISKTEKSGIEKWAEAIKKYEGWYKGSKSYRNNNPGNLKYANQKGAFDTDLDGFAVFDTYESGWNALINQLVIAVNGKSKNYNPEMTLVEFFKVFAPEEDNNEPNAYAIFVAQEIGIDPETKIKKVV
jgi:hypothetical protein